MFSNIHCHASCWAAQGRLNSITHVTRITSSPTLSWLTKWTMTTPKTNVDTSRRSILRFSRSISDMQTRHPESWHCAHGGRAAKLLGYALLGYSCRYCKRQSTGLSSNMYVETRNRKMVVAKRHTRHTRHTRHIRQLYLQVVSGNCIYYRVIQTRLYGIAL